MNKESAGLAWAGGMCVRVSGGNDRMIEQNKNERDDGY